MSVPSSPSVDRVAVQRDGLLSLVRMLVGAQHGGTFSEALEILAQALGAFAGAAYDVERDALVLVAQRGLTLEMRAAIERLPRAEEPWFVASRAAKSRRLVVEMDVAATTSKPEAAQIFAAGVRLHAVAVPLASGREVVGVFVFLHKRADWFDANANAFLETAAGLITLARKAEAVSPSLAALRREEARMGPLAMAGMLAAHFADDVRGPLSAIELVLREEERVLAGAEEAEGGLPGLVFSMRELIVEAQQALGRAQEITHQIASAARAGPKETLSFAELLKDAVALVVPVAETRGVVVVQHVEGDARILGRRSDLIPAIVAMLTNAVQASENGPRARPIVKITLEDDLRGVAVSIEDSGAGVPADVRPRIFDPFFSTHDDAAGIGLTLAKHAIIGHSGHLEISTSPSLGGALFRAVLPLAAGAKKERRTSLSSATLRRLKPRPALLWVDPDEVFLASARRALEGFEMRVAGTAAEAEQLVLQGSPPPEIVFCGLDLPDKSGIDLHAEVARKNAELATRFVFVTDGVLSPERAAYITGSGCPSLLKPLDLDEIRALVQGASTERDLPSSGAPKRGPPSVDDPFNA